MNEAEKQALRAAIRAYGHAKYECGVMNYTGTHEMQESAEANLLAASKALDETIDGVLASVKPQGENDAPPAA